MKQANQHFFYTQDDGVDVFVAKGSVFDDSDPVVKGRDVLFDTLTFSSSARKGKTEVVITPAPAAE